MSYGTQWENQIWERVLVSTVKKECLKFQSYYDAFCRNFLSGGEEKSENQLTRKRNFFLHISQQKKFCPQNSDLYWYIVMHSKTRRSVLGYTLRDSLSFWIGVVAFSQIFPKKVSCICENWNISSHHHYLHKKLFVVYPEAAVALCICSCVPPFHRKKTRGFGLPRWAKKIELSDHGGYCYEANQGGYVFFFLPIPPTWSAAAADLSGCSFYCSTNEPIIIWVLL